MGYSTDQEKLQTTQSIPCIVQDLEYSYPADWTSDTLTQAQALNWDIKLNAVSLASDTSKEAKLWIEYVWRAERGFDGNYSSLPERGINPYFTTWNSFANFQNGDSIIDRYTIDKWSSDLKMPDDSSKCLRFLGQRAGSGNMPIQSGVVNHELLKIDFSKSEGFGPNSYQSNQYDQYVAPLLNHGCEIIFMKGDRPWFNPVVAQRGGTTKTTSVFGPKLKPLSHLGGMNPYGFTTATTDIAITSTQYDYKTKTVLNVLRGGGFGKAEYIVEQYLSNLVEYNLTCHLPDEFEGKEIPYFTDRGKWAGQAFFGTSSQIGADYLTTSAGDAKGCLGPVSFPSAQCPGDEWLWFVSEDEDDNFWLNKLKLGYATRAIAVTKLGRSPIQMEVDDTNVVMVYSDRISIWNIQSHRFTEWVCGDSIGNYKLTAVAIDRTTGHYWFGHSNGAFLFDNGSVADIPTSTWVGAACGRQGLTASNGYVAWSPTEVLEFRGEYAFRRNSYACWWDSNKGIGRAVLYAEIMNGFSISGYSGRSSYAGTLEQLICRVAVRSNGELIITHTQHWIWDNSGNDALAITIVAFNDKLDATPITSMTKWTPDRIGNSYGPGYLMYLLPLKLVSDVKLIGGVVGVPNNIAIGDTSYQWYSALSTGFAVRQMIIEATIDDNHNRIHSHSDAESGTCVSGGISVLNQYTGQSHDRLNFPGVRAAATEFLMTQVSADKVQNALDSLCVVQLKKSFAVFFSGQQDLTAGGMPLSWSGSDWTLPKARKQIASRKIDGTSHSVDTDTTVQFSNVVYKSFSAYGFVCMPSTSDAPDISIYFGDFVEVTESVKVTGVNTPLGCKQFDAFCAIDLDRTSLLKCVVNGTSLTFVASSNPTVDQFSMTANGHIVLSSDHTGLTATVSYGYVAQGA
jgi:hypothetical protein